MGSQPSQKQLLTVLPQLLTFGQDLSHSHFLEANFFFLPLLMLVFSVPLQMSHLGHHRLCSCQFVSSVSAEEPGWGCAPLLAQVVVVILLPGQILILGGAM